MILRITVVEFAASASLRLTFNTGERRTVNVAPLFNGPIFEPLRDPSYFSMARLDSFCGTVVWPNGADFAPEALLALSDD